MLIAYFVSVFLHLVSAAVWFGGMFMAVISGARDAGWRREHRFWSWLSLTLLIVTGTFNLAARGYAWSDMWTGPLWQGHFGNVLAAKLVSLLLIVVLSVSRDRSEDNESKKRALNFLLLTLGLVVLGCAVMLIRGNPW
jgi:putative copper export protein